MSSVLARSSRPRLLRPRVARGLSSSPGQVASTALRWSLIGTGGAVWLWQLFEWWDPDGADAVLGYDGAVEYDKEARRFYGVEEDRSDTARAELDAKDKALFALLKKLERQPELEESLGKDHLALWPGSYGMPGEHERAPAPSAGAWTPSFFLNGPLGSCIVDVVMQKNRLNEWTPTSVRAEQLVRSGRALLNAQADLPHGLAYVNRLSTASAAPAGYSPAAADGS